MNYLNYTSPRKEVHFLGLLSIAKSDGNISNEELAFLRLYGTLAKMTNDKVELLIENFEPNGLDKLKNIHPFEKEGFIMDLLVMSLIDGAATERETDKIYAIAKLLNVSAVTVDRKKEIVLRSEKSIAERILGKREACCITG